MPCDETGLENLTLTYWNKAEGAGNSLDKLNDVIEFYLSQLLPAEIECAKERAKAKPGIWPGKTEQADVLVLLVGFSIDPLLQTICAYSPHEVVLVLNRKYHKPNDGIRFAQTNILPLIKKLDPKLLSRPLDKIRPDPLMPPKKDQPVDIFHFLLKELRRDLENDCKIVIDITGAKKSMVAGAFLFAAYTSAKISYVDFDRYHEIKRRPYGYTCQIGYLPNPYEIFGLRYWERVRELYCQFSFDEARNEVERIIKNISSEYFLTEQKEAADIMRSILDFFSAWSNDDYYRAKKFSDDIHKKSKKFKPLQAVEALHDEWPEDIELDQDLKITEWEFYADHELPLQYAVDECNKVTRIVELKKDFRSGLLRAAGLNEVLMKARMAFLLKRGRLTLYNNSRQLNANEAQNQIAKEIKAFFAEMILQGDNGIRISHRYSPIQVQKSSDALLCMNGSPNHFAKLKMTRERRNKVTHFVRPVPEKIAIEAIEIMQENVRDFKRVWVSSVSPDHHIQPEELPDWDELCKWCGIDFLPFFR